MIKSGMKKRILTTCIMVGLVLCSGCAKRGTEGAPKIMEQSTSKSDQTAAQTDVDQILKNQKIIFIMSVSSYEDPYAAGYFIDASGKKHRYELYDRGPFRSIEEEYVFLLERYDEFEPAEGFEDQLFQDCVGNLCLVNPEAPREKEGTVIMDYPYKALYGIRQKDGREEIVFLESDTGIRESLKDPHAEKLYEAFGESWYLLK